MGANQILTTRAHVVHCKRSPYDTYIGPTRAPVEALQEIVEILHNGGHVPRTVKSVTREYDKDGFGLEVKGSVSFKKKIGDLNVSS